MTKYIQVQTELSSFLQTSKALHVATRMRYVQVVRQERMQYITKYVDISWIPSLSRGLRTAQRARGGSV